MGGGLEVGLSHGAVAGMWRSPALGWRPVLQVADVRHVPDGSGLRPAPEQRYRLDLSDGVHLQPGTLDASLNHLVIRDAALRRGSVVRVLDFVCDYNRRTITVLQLQILQTECALIGSLKLYEPKPTRKSGGLTTRSMRYAFRPDCEPYFGGQHIHQSCIASKAQESAHGLSYLGPCRGSSLPVGDTLCSDGLLAEPAVWKMVQQIKDEHLGYYGPDFIIVKAAISFINTQRLCTNRYVHRFGSCDYGYSVKIQIQDHTGAIFATAYEEAAKEIFGYTAKELYLMEYDAQYYKQLNDITLGTVCKQYVLWLKVEEKPLSDGRVECAVLKAEKVNPSAESHRLLGSINTVLGEGVDVDTCWESGNYMATYSDVSDFKGRSAVQSSSGSHTTSPGPGCARSLGSVGRFSQQVKGYTVEPPVPFSPFGACGCGNHGSNTDGLRSSPPNGFLDVLYGASSAVNIAPDVPFRSNTPTSAHGAERSPGKPKFPGAISRR